MTYCCCFSFYQYAAPPLVLVLTFSHNCPMSM